MNKTLIITANEELIDIFKNLIEEKIDTNISIDRNKVKITIQKTANETIKEIIDNLNNVCGTSFKATTKPTIAHINARLTEGYTLDDFRHVISYKADEWQNTEWSKFLRPDTLFGNKFESYLMAAKKDSEPVQHQARRKAPEPAL